MATQTSKLKLVLPEQGAVNWGNAVNNNFNKIDSEFITIEDTVEALQKAIGNIGCIDFYEHANYIKFDTDGTNQVIKFGTVDDKGFHARTKQDNEDINPNGLYNPINSSDPDYVNRISALPNYQGYYIYNGYKKADNNDFTDDYFWSRDWIQGEVAYKVSIIENNTRLPKIIDFPQLMGGYYVPSTILTQQNTGELTIIWERQVPNQTVLSKTEKWQFDLPYAKTGLYQTLLNGSSVVTSDNKTFTISLPSSTLPTDNTYPLAIDFILYKKDSGIWTRAYVESVLIYDNGWKLQLRFSSVINGSNYSCIITYYKSDGKWWNTTSTTTNDTTEN